MTDSAEQKLAALGLELPQPMQTGNLPFELIRIDGRHAYLAGHVPLALDGSMAKPLGKVGGEVSPEQGYTAARLCALGFLATIRQAVGTLDAVDGWLKLFGMVNVAPGFNNIPAVINGIHPQATHPYPVCALSPMGRQALQEEHRDQPQHSR